ncbi:hypothetical protein D7B24_001498 [Verticillium nonalfalfae]|uniref:Uncharacterized protein n=1 Tax=Verticillium nonalfalfae TaxID=1051616 RepID=A0A3M9YGR7_9PEZI|nr:uncharacterized protein D7B24_001498 [Verticillium nonalfalfae]RNJ59773.1 hypothetical protein D7B24_001498 [Verticillium nonalfalfae]
MTTFESWQHNAAALLPTRRPRQLLILIGAFLVTLLLVSVSLQNSETSSWRVRRPWATDVDTIPVGTVKGDDAIAEPKRMHMVIPVSKSDPRFCKNMLAQTILGYPRPTVVMWDQKFDDDRYLGKGSHLAKISGTLKWLEDPKNKKYDDDLVIMIDAYDVWFQLPPETLVARYHALRAAEDKRIAQRMGKAFTREKISSKVIFSASKRCGPNEIRSVACYPVPESPLPNDIYGAVTDTMDGPSQWAGLRTRHLVSGFIIGPVKDMRRIFQRANRNMAKCLEGDQKGDKYYLPKCHKGSDQSFFNEMFGQQEYHREVMRRHHRNAWDRFLDGMVPTRPGAPRRPHKIETLLIDDPLNPSFDHQLMSDPDYHADQRYEFGIMVDHFSEVSHQTSNALHDTTFVNHSAPLGPQVDKPAHGQKIICSPRAPMPSDLVDNAGGLELFAEQGRPRWEQLPLYSEVCNGVIPVVAHHNWVNKKPIDTLWPSMWWTGHARQLFDARRAQAKDESERKRVGGVDTDTGKSLTWDDLCPAEWEKDVFLD